MNGLLLNYIIVITGNCRLRKVMRKWKSWLRWQGNKPLMLKTSKKILINSYDFADSVLEKA